MATSSSKPTPTGSLTDFRALSTIAITAIGLGILELPSSISNVGPVQFFVILALAGWSSWYMVILFQRCLCLKAVLTPCTPLDPEVPASGTPDAGTSSSVYNSYVEVGEAALGPIGKGLGVFVNHGSLLGICTCLIMVFGGVMDRMLPLSGSEGPSMKGWIAIGTVLTQPAVWIRSMKNVSLLGTAGVASMVLLSVVIVIAGFSNYSANKQDIKHTESKLSNLTVQSFASTFSTVVFAFGAIPIIPAVSKDMQNPGHFGRVSLMSYLLIAAINGVVAGVGFLGWGDTLKEGGILPTIAGPRDKAMDAYGWISSILAFVVVFTHIIVLIRPVSDAMEKLGSKFLRASDTTVKAELVRKVARSLPSLVMLFVGSFVKDVGGVIAFVAAFTVILLCILLPPVFYLALKAKVMKSKGEDVSDLWRREVAVIVPSTLACACGIVGMIWGTYAAFKRLSK